MDISEQLQNIGQAARKALDEAASVDVLEQLRVSYLGKKGELTSILRGLKELPVEARKAIGGEANRLKADLERIIAEKRDEMVSGAALGADFDYTLPGRPYYHGHRHLVTMVMDEAVAIFQRMGFEITDGPEIEDDYHNFGALNFPDDHPARDEQDTFYVEGDLLLRTHTSPVQIREFKKRTPPVKIIAPGKVFRNEAVSARSACVFHQIEGFYVDKNVTFADLKGTLEAFCYEFFQEGVELRFRPSFFPFTEPSAEVDVRCLFCGGSGCTVCKYEGWLEILGCGMIDPAVFRAVGYDPDEVSGYAFGTGMERPAMLRHGVGDIRLLYENDIRFIRQFR
jgi:phenylalanyl-tRNA synthetase alpha chain